jgi:hypothetical protein
MFLRQAQANNSNSVVIGALREDHHIKADFDQPDGNDANFSIIEPLIFALESCVPINAGSGC